MALYTFGRHAVFDRTRPGAAHYTAWCRPLKSNNRKLRTDVPQPGGGWNHVSPVIDTTAPAG
jgi:hypothetical protein